MFLPIIHTIPIILYGIKLGFDLLYSLFFCVVNVLCGKQWCERSCCQSSVDIAPAHPSNHCFFPHVGGTISSSLHCPPDATFQMCVVQTPVLNPAKPLFWFWWPHPLVPLYSDKLLYSCLGSIGCLCLLFGHPCCLTSFFSLFLLLTMLLLLLVITLLWISPPYLIVWKCHCISQLHHLGCCCQVMVPRQGHANHEGY